jgi:CRP-like cAMP-binding protein
LDANAQRGEMDQLGSTQQLFSNLALAGLTLPFLLGSMAWLRAAATAGGLLVIGYLAFSGEDLATAVAWAAALIAINGFQLYRLYRENSGSAGKRSTEEEDPMLRLALSGLNDTQISRLMKAAEVKECDSGDVLTRQKKPVNSLYFLYAGRANVEVDGKTVAALDNGAFIGEIAYLTGKLATATVVVDKPSRILTFSRARLNKVIAEDPQISGIIYELLGRDLARKMGQVNSQRTASDLQAARI